MRTTGGLRLLAIGVVALLLMLAGCAATPVERSSAWPAAASTETTTAPPAPAILADATSRKPPITPPARPRIRPAPSRAHLASAVITTSDVPSSWIQHGHVTYDQMGAWPVSIVAGCLGVRNTDPALITTVDSGNFDRIPADLLVRVASYRSQTAVASDAAAVFRPGFAPCYVRWARRHGITAPGATISDVRARVWHRTSSQPASVVANLEETFVLSGHGTSDRIYSNEIWIRGRDTEATVDFINTDSRVPAQFQAKIVATVARRVAKL